MDKYEYNQKTEQMLELMEEGSYRKAAEIADTIDWKKVRNAAMLTNVSDIYEQNKEYGKSYNVLNLAYHRAEGSRKIISKLCTLAVKTGNVNEALEYYDDFMQIAPKDPNQYILKYQILRAQRAPIEQQIEALEEYKKSEYIEEWAYELAKLYQEAGMTAECLEECDDLILWFSEGKYVYKAMELKMQYKPLTPSQQEKYDKRFEKFSAETEEMPDIAAYMGQDEDEEENENEEKNSSIELTDQQEGESLQEKAEDSEEHTEEADDSESVRTEENIPAPEGNTEDKIEENTTGQSEDSKSVKTDIKKKKIGNTMPLDVALRQLLHPEKKVETENVDEEPPLDDLEQAIDEIESVADADMVKQLAEKKKAKRIASSAGEMMEIIPDDDDDQIDGQMNLEDILNEWEGEAESLTEDTEPDDLLEIDDGEELSDLDFEAVEEIVEETELPEADAEEIAEEAELPEADAEEIAEETELPEADAEEIIEEADMPETDAEEIEEEEELLEADAGESIIEETAESDIEEETEDNLSEPEGESEGETMEDQKTKKTEPILPPDIQRMIDEIEGVIPPQEEEEKAPVKRTLKRKEEPRENMGKVADSLRMDDEDDLDVEDYLDSEEAFDDEFEEDYLDEEPEDLADEEDYFDEESEDLADEEDYFDEGSEDLTDEEDYFDEEPEELTDEEDYLDEEPEELTDEEDYFDEEAEDLADEEDYFDEESEDLADEEDYFDEEAEELTDEEDYFDEEAEDLADEEDYFDEEEEDLPDKEDLFGEPIDEAIGFEDEFRINPEHSSETDDREIPDDDDDNMDILSSTKPLSRKETAKLIATGKTAPLPLDEISDALSMTDTGFIVHGRYDLEMQSGIGTRAGLTDEQKKLFSYFVPVRGMSEQLVDVLEQDKNCTNRQGTSRTGNLLIVGNKGNGKTVLAVDVVKAIQKQRNIRQGKVAIVTGDSLNKKKIGDIFEKLYGGALIIEKAGKMNEKTVARLNKAMEKNTGELLIVLEEQRKPIDRLLSSNREFRRKFTSRLEVPIFINDELVTFGQTYAQENGYRIDEMGILALYSRIDSLQREDHAVTVAEVKEIMDEAIQHSQKASAKKLVRRVFGKNTDDSDRILLSEKDFNI